MSTLHNHTRYQAARSNDQTKLGEECVCQTSRKKRTKKKHDCLTGMAVPQLINIKIILKSKKCVFQNIDN